MRKIGFVDFYLDEWHANNYPAWIRSASEASGLDYDVGLAWAETSRPGGMDTAAWCARYGVRPAASLEELVAESDCLLVLSPDNPERHEDLARLPLMSGKPVYIDKTFSPDLPAGVRLFERAASYRTPLFSSSALRFSAELAKYPDQDVNPASLEYVASLGPGQFSNYAVHQLEMIVALLGPGAKRIKSLSAGHARTLIIDYPDGRRAAMTQIAELPFQLSLQLSTGKSIFINPCTDFFPRLITAMLNFFDTGRPPVPHQETLTIMALLDAGRQALMKDDIWIPVAEVT